MYIFGKQKIMRGTVSSRTKKESKAKAPKEDEYVMEFVHQGGPDLAITSDARNVAKLLSNFTGLSVHEDSNCLNLVPEGSRNKLWPIFTISAEEGRGVVVSFFGWNGPASEQRAILRNVENALNALSADFEIDGNANSIVVLQPRHGG